MTRPELRASVALALVFALRMLGLFLILPVFALEARRMPGGDNATLVGLALGAYGLVQALLQLPLGMASDRIGRKPVIVAGLLLFAVGSLVAATAQDVVGVLIGRAPARCRRRSPRWWPTAPGSRSAPRRWPWSAPRSG